MHTPIAALCLFPQEHPGLVIRTETNLALVRFHVLRKNRYVAGLRAEDVASRRPRATRASGSRTVVH